MPRENQRVARERQRVARETERGGKRKRRALANLVLKASVGLFFLFKVSHQMGDAVRVACVAVAQLLNLLL